MTEKTIVSELASRLNENLRELYEERAGIMEFDAGLSREHAECLAMLNLYLNYPLAILGVSLHRLKTGEYLLVSNSRTFAANDCCDLVQVDIHQALAELGGVVKLVAFR